jgi:hypothetical protein
LGSAVAAGVGGMVGMAGALGYGFKLLVDVVSKQLGFQNDVITDLKKDIGDKLDIHMDECKKDRDMCACFQKGGK